MPLAIVQAVTEEAHAHGKPVFAHPTNAAGLSAAVEGGVDVVVHTAPMAGRLPDSLHEAMVRRKVALVPTLALFEWELKRANEEPLVLERFTQAGAEQVRHHARLGGRILFGTDVGNSSARKRGLAGSPRDWTRMWWSSTETRPGTSKRSPTCAWC